MESQTKCNDTTGESIQNTSAKVAKRGVPAKYQLLDLHRLTFRLEGMEQVFNVEAATPEQFEAFAEAFADVEDVDIAVWPLEVRRDLINELWDFCVNGNFDFPLTEIPVEPASEAAGA